MKADECRIGNDQATVIDIRQLAFRRLAIPAAIFAILKTSKFQQQHGFDNERTSIWKPEVRPKCVERDHGGRLHFEDCAARAFRGGASLCIAKNLATEIQAMTFLKGLGGETLATEENAMRVLQVAKSRPTGYVLAGVIAASGAAYIYEWFAAPARNAGENTAECSHGIKRGIMTLTPSWQR